MKPLSRILIYPLSALVLAVPATAQTGGDPATMMPADVFEYLELDAGALDRGIHQLDLVQLLEDPDFQEFFLPLFNQIGVDPNQPIDSLLARAPIDQFLAGHAAVGIRGLRFWVEQPDGTSTRVEISPNSPITARAILDVVGLFGSYGIDSDTGRPWNLDELKYEMGLDLVAVLEPGPALQQHVEQLLANPMPPIKEIHQDQIAGRTVTHMSLDVEMTYGIVSDIYIDMSGPTWLIATSLQSFEAAANVQPSSSLAAAPNFQKVHARMTSGDPVLFGYADFGLEMGMIENFLPPIYIEFADILGLTTMQGTGMALSMTEGGIHESFGLVFDGEPKGAFRILDAFPGGIEMAGQAPAGAMSLMAVKFDAAMMFGRMMEFMDTMAPGTGRRIAALAEAQVATMGYSLQDELLGAFGDEASVVIFPPVAMMAVPDWVISVDVRNADAANRIINTLTELAVADGAPIRFQPTEIGDNLSGQAIRIEGAPVLPIMAVTDGKLIIGSRKDIVNEAVYSWNSDRLNTMANSAVYKRTMKGLANGRTDNIAALAYLDLQQIAPPAIMMTMGMWPEGVVDAVAAPDAGEFAEHLGGIALAVRNDEYGITFDSFSPVGFVIPGLVAALSVGQQTYAAAPMTAIGTPSNPANDLNTQAWFKVRFAGQDKDGYVEGLDMAISAVEMDPENHWYLNTLGVALFRNGQYERALRTFQRCQDANATSDNRYDAASDTLFLAMTHYRLGDLEIAQEMLKAADGMVGPGSDPEINNFYSEANAMIGK
jgi:hypothetical protein